MLKRHSNEKTGPANTKLVKRSSLQEREHETDQAESSLDQDSGVHSMDVDDDENEATTWSTIVEESITGDNGSRSWKQQKACKLDMITCDLEWPRHDYCIICGYDVMGADFENSLYAFGQSEKS